MAVRRRTYKVAEQIRMSVASSLRKVADPRLELATITSVSVSADLRHAKVYWMGHDRSKIEDMQRAFDGASGFFKRQLAKDLRIKAIPELRFYYDDTLDTREEINALLERVSLAEGSESK
ncbi:MAG: 30S ribosome-binding factor RbfA [Candidatus Dadabacteria bacterium]|nr:MAG: 30S ribosome-binding factor RbfA [Candidatus Dadabacteria bacterium]